MSADAKRILSIYKQQTGRQLTLHYFDSTGLLGVEWQGERYGVMVPIHERPITQYMTGQFPDVEAGARELLKALPPLGAGEKGQAEKEAPPAWGSPEQLAKMNKPANPSGASGPLATDVTDHPAPKKRRGRPPKKKAESPAAVTSEPGPTPIENVDPSELKGSLAELIEGVE